MESPEMKTLLHINETNKFSADGMFQYFYKLHTMLITQHLMLREILIKLGSSPEEVNLLIQDISEMSQTFAEQVLGQVVTSAGKKPQE